MALKRMDNVGIVVEDLAATIEFFRELGLELEGQATVEGDWAERVTGLHPMRVEIAMIRTPDGHSRLEISRFLTPRTVADHRNAPVNALGYLRVMFAVDDIDETQRPIARSCSPVPRPGRSHPAPRRPWPVSSVWGKPDRPQRPSAAWGGECLRNTARQGGHA